MTQHAVSYFTFVTAGGGFSGAETAGAINDFVRETVRYYPQLGEHLVQAACER